MTRIFEILKQFLTKVFHKNHSSLSEKDKLGKDGENRVVQFLKNEGYKIIDRNVRFSIGEIDIIAKIQKTLIFVEVKTRRTAAYAHPVEAVNAKKRQKIRQMGFRYFHTKKYKHRGFTIRFDVVTLIWRENEEPVIEHFTDAFR
ncbi:MAG: YraN family protein [Planctomycetaceae bacterium]|nr:YraN family protein [Planctomycetaceae bacterium]